jgi:hypothetical protein
MELPAPSNIPAHGGRLYLKSKALSAADALPRELRARDCAPARPYHLTPRDRTIETYYHYVILLCSILPTWNPTGP